MRRYLPILFSFLLLFFLISCTTSEDDLGEPQNETTGSIYFPPTQGEEWAALTPESLGWDQAQVSDLLQFLEENNTRAFLLLKDGKIVLEEYFGKNLVARPFTAENNWYWASAGKSLKSMLVGIAKEEGYLDIHDPTSNYLGVGWTSLEESQENQITIWHQLTMTSGLDDTEGDKYCTDPNCLTFKAAPGSRWAYHNAPYTLLTKVVENAVGQSFDAYFNEKIKPITGMDGFWSYVDYNHLYFSTPRSMARFGLLMLNKGKWANQPVLEDEAYWESMIQTSQDINRSYGLLWWLNGKSSIMVPGIQIPFNRSLTPSAPEDMYAAMGKNGQLLNIVPSQGLVMVRMGENPGNSLVPVQFQEDLWEKINLVMRK